MLEFKHHSMEQNQKSRILIVSFDFPPLLGGVATCAHKISQSLAAQPNTEVFVITSARAGSEIFDQAQIYEVQGLPFCGRPRIAAIFFVPVLAWKILSWRPTALLNMIWF